MKSLVLFILLFIGIAPQETKKPVLLKRQVTIVAEGKLRNIGFYEYRPADYDSVKHPVIIYLHGIGEKGLDSLKTGTDSTTIGPVLRNQIAKLLPSASMKFSIGPKSYSFVVLAPQLSNAFSIWKPFYVTEMLKYIKKDSMIDTTRIYLTGMSLGGGGVYDALEVDSICRQLAAAAIVCGTNRLSSTTSIVKNRIPLWLFHAKNDPQVSYYYTEKAFSTLKKADSTLYIRKSIYMTGGHGIWNRAYDTLHPTYLLSSGLYNTMTPNLYEWFLRYRKY